MMRLTEMHAKFAAWAPACHLTNAIVKSAQLLHELPVSLGDNLIKISFPHLGNSRLLTRDQTPNNLRVSSPNRSFKFILWQNSCTGFEWQLGREPTKQLVVCFVQYSDGSVPLK